MKRVYANLALLSLLSISFSFFLPTAFSRTKLPSPTATLDVSGSLQNTRGVLSFDPQSQTSFSEQEQEQRQEQTSSGSFSVRLHPRESLVRTPYREYKALVLARLGRDSARVDALASKLNLALNNVTRTDLTPLRTEIQPEDLSTPVSSGTSQGSGEYFSRIGVGTPAKQFYMVLDTGSDVNWLQCQPCTDCYQQTDPVFTPSSSSSYTALTCESPQCGSLEVSACRTGKCLYQVSYGDGSFTVGDFVTETVSFGDSGSVNDVALGCGHDNEGLFMGSAGLLGLGGGPLSLTKQVKASSFSYCLVDRDSSKSSTLDFNSAAPGAESVFAPLVKNGKVDTFYYVGLTGMSVGGKTVSIPPSLFQMDESGDGGIIVDSGTAITRLQTQAYNSLRDAFVKLTPDLKSTSGVALFDTCYDFSSLSSVQVPTVSFQFTGGRSLALPAKNYLIPVDSAGTFCFAFAPTTSSLSIIGNVQQQGTRVTFDLAKSRVGFTPNKC
ncbi:protein ASPARTIC PROTEASE IN GUARD CELL 1-like [Eucalyptus grandis]|uniref:protein ASPARTIC PROTEASE IN GUARD CELL 1-like n=1 Tax=Eucalyptus grandis TaxID=71139 RepID=UPI00192EE1D9|nr:protein ASPARTIC PROTEASE IN GUARD CELL 1-like [Eucalyptus grandis]